MRGYNDAYAKSLCGAYAVRGSWQSGPMTFSAPTPVNYRVFPVRIGVESIVDKSLTLLCCKVVEPHLLFVKSISLIPRSKSTSN